MKHYLAFSTVILTIVVLVSRVHAQSPAASMHLVGSSDADTAPPAETHWYGYQVMIADSVAITAAMIGWDLNQMTNSTAASAAIVVAALGGPLVHVANGRTTQGLFSLGLRVAAPVAVFVAIGQDPCGSDSGLCGLRRAGTGAALAVAAAMVVDWAFLSKRSTASRPVDATAAPAGWSMVPTVSIGQDGARLGMAGSF